MARGLETLEINKIHSLSLPFSLLADAATADAMTPYSAHFWREKTNRHLDGLGDRRETTLVITEHG